MAVIQYTSEAWLRLTSCHQQHTFHGSLDNPLITDFPTKLPSGYVKIAIENGPVEIVDFPINSMVIFHSYVNVYQRVHPFFKRMFQPWTDISGSLRSLGVPRTPAPAPAPPQPPPPPDREVREPRGRSRRLAKLREMVVSMGMWICFIYMHNCIYLQCIYIYIHNGNIIMGIWWEFSERELIY